MTALYCDDHRQTADRFRNRINLINLRIKHVCSTFYTPLCVKQSTDGKKPVYAGVISVNRWGEGLDDP